MEMTLARAIAASIVMGIWVNKDIKEIMVGQIETTCLPSLIFRCLQGALSLFNGFLLLQYFYVSTISIVCALTPIFTCIMAYFIFGSDISSADVRALIAIFVAIGLILTGGEEKIKSANFCDPNAFIFLVLFC
jgi:drug/metabolite transporter (DMT)-like permease